MRKCIFCFKKVKMAIAAVHKKKNGKWVISHFVDVCPNCDSEQPKKQPKKI